MDKPSEETVAIITAAYEAFNTRNIDAATSLMTDDVMWARAWEGGYAHGHDGVRGYWEGQWLEIVGHVTPVSMSVAEDGRVLVEVDQKVQSHAGELIFEGRVQHAFTLRTDLVARFDVI